MRSVYVDHYQVHGSTGEILKIQHPDGRWLEIFSPTQEQIRRKLAELADQGYTHSRGRDGKPRPLSWYFVEVTDTFGGEANYSWVTRYRVNATSKRGAIGKVSRETGHHFRGDGYRYDAHRACVCAFVDEWEEDSHGNYHVREV